MTTDSNVIKEAILKSYSAEDIAPILIKNFDLVPPTFSKGKPHFGEFEIDGIRDVYGLLKSEEITTFIIKWPAGQSSQLPPPLRGGGLS